LYPCGILKQIGTRSISSINVTADEMTALNALPPT
jgi:hypothetical protein